MSYICDPFYGIFEIVPRSLHKVGRALLVAVVKVSRPILSVTAANATRFTYRSTGGWHVITIVVGYVLYEKTRVNDRREGRLNLTFMDICRDRAMLENSPLNN